MLEIRRLRLLWELQQRGTIGAVADALFHSAPGISQQLAKLESEVKVKLIEHVGRGVRLTDAGERLAEHAAAILSRMEEAEADLENSVPVLRGSLHVATFQTAATRLLTPALTRLGVEYPELRICISEFEPDLAIQELLRGSVDVAIVDDYAAQPERRHASLLWNLLLSDPLRIALPRSHPEAQSGKPVALRALRYEAWTAGLAGSAYAETVIRTCNEAGGFNPDVRHHTSDLQIMVAIVSAGQGVAFLPDLVGAKAVPEIALRDIKDVTVARSISTVVRRSVARRRSVVALRTALREVASQYRDDEEIN